MSPRVYVLRSKSFDPMWEKAYADSSRTDTYLNVYDACVFLKFVVGWHILSGNFLYVIIVGFLAVGKAWLSRSTSRSTEDNGIPHSADSRSAVLPDGEQVTLQRWPKKWSALSRTQIIFHTPHLSHATYIHTYMHTCVQTKRKTPQDGSPSNAGRLAVDPVYMPGMITSHRVCRKSSQNSRLRPKECRTLPWSAEVWWADHRFDSRAWWNSKQAEQLTHKQPTHKQLTLHTDIHTYIDTYIHYYLFTHFLALSHTLFHILL